MNIFNRIKLLSGMDVWHTDDINGEMPSILLSDGPSGIRKQIDKKDNLGINSSVPATLFPPLVTLACSFNPQMAYLLGDAIGKEARGNNVAVVLAPGINIKRNAMCGRNFEYLSEDPYLSGTLGKHYIEGIQNNNVGESLKHFAVNNQEDYRFNIDAVVDERALREIYLKNFEIALKANPRTVMCSYNKLNGTQVANDKWLLTDVLRGEFKYPGLVVSDWGAVSDPVKSLIAGMDLEMPSTYGSSERKIKKALKKKIITEAQIETSVRRVEALVNDYKDNELLSIDYEYSKEVARRVARESIVLLKNDNILPFSITDKILVIGEFSGKPRNQGGGSSFVNSIEEFTLLDKIVNYTNNYKYLRGYSLEDSSENEKLLQESVINAKDFDKVLIMAGLDESSETEGIDRQNIDLPFSQIKLIKELSKVNKNIVVNLYVGSAVAMPFSEDVKGIINSHLLGMDSGTPLLDIIFGKVSPSGRLAYTNPIKIEDDITTKNFANSNNAIYYLESIYVGYRYFDTFKKPVQYPFGYGLSYSSFEYSDLIIDANEINKDQDIKVSVKVKNIGHMRASEVVLLFVENNKSSVYKPLRELRKFDKVELDVNEERVVTFTLNYNDFSYYDINLKRFHVDKGIYKVQVCKNARDVILEIEVEKKENDADFSQHEISKYHDVDKVEVEDFQKLFPYELPNRNVKRRRPFTLDNNLEDVKDTFIGKIMYKMVFKEVKKLYKSDDKNWVINVVNNTVGKTPLRVIATMSNGIISLRQMQALVDLMNFKIFKGLFNIWRK